MSSLKLINTQTVSGVALVNFISGIDSTYDVYNVKFFNVTPVTDNVDLQVNWTNNGGTDWDTDKVTATFKNVQGLVLQYQTDIDSDQPSYQGIVQQQGNNGSECCAGEGFLFNPSSTALVKHIMFNTTWEGGYVQNMYVNGFLTSASAVDGMSFKFSSGNIATGTFSLYGLVKS